MHKKENPTYKDDMKSDYIFYRLKKKRPLRNRDGADDEPLQFHGVHLNVGVGRQVKLQPNYPSTMHCLLKVSLLD